MTHDPQTKIPTQSRLYPLIRRGTLHCRRLLRLCRLSPIVSGEIYRLTGIVAAVTLIGLLILTLWHVLISLGPIERDGDDWIFMPLVTDLRLASKPING